MLYIVLYTSTLDMQLLLNIPYNTKSYQDLSMKIQSHPLIRFLDGIYAKLENPKEIQQKIFAGQLE